MKEYASKSEMPLVTMMTSLPWLRNETSDGTVTSHVSVEDTLVKTRWVKGRKKTSRIGPILVSQARKGRPKWSETALK